MPKYIVKNYTWYLKAQYCLNCIQVYSILFTLYAVAYIHHCWPWSNKETTPVRTMFTFLQLDVHNFTSTCEAYDADMIYTVSQKN